MPKVGLIALKRHPYGKRLLTPGQAFDAESEGDATLLVNLGMAKRADTPAQPMRLRPMPVERVEIPAAPSDEPAATGESESEPAPPERSRRTYKRRDLTAEE